MRVLDNLKTATKELGGDKNVLAALKKKLDETVLQEAETRSLNTETPCNLSEGNSRENRYIKYWMD